MHSHHHVCVPGVIPMHEPMCDGSKIDIKGHVPHDSERFVVELLSGPHVVLHIDFRFHPEHAVVMNSQANGCWGSEVRHHNHIHKGEDFHIVIKGHHGHYDIKANGEHIGEFHHRHPMESVQALGLRGHAHVHSVHFEGFHFKHQWGSHHDSHHFGHSGWAGYGTDSYVAPHFHSGHGHHSFWA